MIQQISDKNKQWYDFISKSFYLFVYLLFFFALKNSQIPSFFTRGSDLRRRASSRSLRIRNPIRTRSRGSRFVFELFVAVSEFVFLIFVEFIEFMMLSYGIIAKDLAQFSIGNPKKRGKKKWVNLMENDVRLEIGRRKFVFRCNCHTGNKVRRFSSIVVWFGICGVREIL